METRSYIFIEEQYTTLPIPQEFLDERVDELEPLIIGQDEEGNPISEPRTPANTSISSAISAYAQTKKINGKSPVSRYWFNGLEVPTKLSAGQNAPTETVEVDGEFVEQERTGGKIFWLIPIPNFTIAESYAMIKNTQVLNITTFPIILSHKQMLALTREGILPNVDLS